MSSINPDIGVIDDFALRPFTAPQADDLYELITERHQRGSLIVTSNRQPSDWYPLFTNPVVADSVLDRLVNTSHHLLMEGRSYRPNQRPGSPARAKRSHHELGHDQDQVRNSVTQPLGNFVTVHNP